MSGPPPTGAEAEQRALRISIAGSAVLGAIGIGWGLVAESRVVLFDGAFTVIGILMSGISLLAASTAATAPTQRFPFGKRAATPLAIGVQGAALLGTLTYAAIDAVLLIRGGGTDVAPGAVLGYGLVSAALSAWVGWLLTHLADSELVSAEAAQWRAGAILSTVIAIGGLGALWLTGGRWDEAVAYVDPVLVLVACAVIGPMPFRLLRSAGLELLEAAPPAEVNAEIASAIAGAREYFGLPAPHVAATKLGTRLYLEVVFLVDRDWPVSAEDQVRHAIIDRLAPLGYDVWANVELTTDADLAE